ncbi:short-chain fatty acid transporter [Janibacter corallicola]|uniref:short-chain fatty acid transporter n=1 Tax=Janibacter corallicola TaxID=415212 RepID=UPI000829C3F5|nr:TIGR00366 family protein [Janibacter corallicola]
MLRALSRPLVRLAERYLPTAFVFAVALTLIVGVGALLATDSGPVEVVRAWGDGLTGLLTFMTQMALVLLLGYMLANTGPVRRLLDLLARLPRSPAQAYGFVALCAAIASLITWGLGLVVAALLSIEVARVGRDRGMKLHYPLLVAAGYSGFVVWHMGYSGSGPLAAATPDSFVDKQIGQTIPLSDTVLSWWNIAGAAVTVVLVVTAMMLMAPGKDDRVIELPEGASLEDAQGNEPIETTDESTPAERIDTSRVVTLVTGLLLLAYLVIYFAQEGAAVTLDIVNWTFLCLVLLLVRNTRELGALVSKAAANVGEILVQFPLYAGIMGIMTTTGLVTILADFFVSISNETTLGLWAFLAGGIINVFVPSGGGQFAIQAPIFLDAAKQLGVDPAIVVMGVSYGDQWTNMIQPFWALPMLAIARLRIRDVMGFTTVTLIVSGIVFAATMVVASL